jgi:excisionase family DNA binding protein
MYDLNKKTIRNWTSAKRIPYHKVGALVRFNLKEIDQWLKEQKVSTISASPLSLLR